MNHERGDLVNSRGGSYGLIGTAVALSLVFGARVAAAEIIAPQNHPQLSSDGWQAGTCFSDSPLKECSVDTSELFFEQAAGHPQVGFTQFIVKHTTGVPLPTSEEPVGDIKTVRVDLPVGLSVNPQATPQCKQSTFEATPLACPVGSNVGESFATAALLGIVSPQIPATVYNIDPPTGEPARFGFNLLGNNVYLKAGVAWAGDYHEFFTIEAPTSPVGHVLKNRLVFNGRAGNGTFITTPTTCYDSTQAAFKHTYSTLLRADSVQEPDPSFPNGSPFIESELPPNTNPKECSTVPFGPSIETAPNTPQTDSPDGAAVDVKLPFEVPLAPELALEKTKQASSQVKTAKVALPQGMGINPSAANGLQTCTNAQFGKGTTNPVGCPAASKVGVVTVETPPLPAGSLVGNVYVGQQLSRDPTSGNEYRIFVDAESTRYGISARLVGNVSADPQTGRLTTTFADNPQVPVSSFKLDFDDGAKAVLTSPPTCGPNTTSTQITPWSGNADATPSGKFSLTKAPGGGACAKTMAERPFAPTFAAKSTNPKAGAYTQVNANIARSDGNQELKGVDVELPPGLTAKLKGVKYCPAANLAAAAASGGLDQAAKSSCPNSSLLGSVTVQSGTGPNPIHIDGKAFLAGPYHGAPLSLAVVTPATAGPFDLGTVVVRVALFVDPATAQVQAVSDPIPHVYGGALLDIRSIALKIDRDKFALNPTNCAQMAIAGTLKGGGADPNNPATFSSDPVSTPFQVNDCNSLGFKPKLKLRLFGKTHRNQHPRLRATLTAREGDANIGRAAVALPHAIFLDQGSLSQVCTREQFAADACPKRSIYGHARAFSPLLDKPLEGPVYLRSSNNLLPDLVAALKGQVEIDLDGRIDSYHGGIRTTYDAVPDVPVSKFVLTLPGGKHGLLVASRNLCQKPVRAITRLKAQNGKKANRHPKLKTPCKGKGHGKRLHHHTNQ
jgi:hypothetical protein